MCKNEISDNDLENVAAGYRGVIGYGNKDLVLNQEERNELQKNGFIVDGKLTISNVEAAKYLEKKGYHGKLFYTGCMPLTQEQIKNCNDIVNQIKNSKNKF